jgi:hypothetical protein
VDARPILGLQQMRPPFLDDLSAAETRSRAGAARSRSRASGTCACRRTCVISHKMSRHYVLEYPVDDPDDEDDDDVDDDDEDEDDEDDDEEEIETWQVSNVRRFR